MPWVEHTDLQNFGLAVVLGGPLLAAVFVAIRFIDRRRTGIHIGKKTSNTYTLFWLALEPMLTGI